MRFLQDDDSSAIAFELWAYLISARKLRFSEDYDSSVISARRSRFSEDDALEMVEQRRIDMVRFLVL
jgi:hypothetical protein